MKSDDLFHCVFIRLHGNKTYQSRPRGSRAFRLSSRTINKSSSRRTIPKIGYLCMLIGSEVYILLLLTYFDANSDYWRVRSSHKTTFQQILIFVLLTSYWLLDCNVASMNLVLPPKINISINCSVLCLNNILALFVFYSKPNNTL